MAETNLSYEASRAAMLVALLVAPPMPKAYLAQMLTRVGVTSAPGLIDGWIKCGLLYDSLNGLVLTDKAQVYLAPNG